MSKRSLLTILLISFSLILISCEDKPNVYLCTIVIEEGSLHCKNLQTKETKDLPLEEANKYYAISPDDYNTLTSWYKAQCKPQTHHPYDRD